MVAGLAVEHRALAAGVGRDHAAERGAVRGRELGGEEAAVRAQRRVQLVLDDAGLDARPALGGVDLQDGVHEARQVDADAGAERGSGGAGAAAAGAQRDVAEGRIGQRAGDAHQVGAAAGEQDGLGRHLVDRIVGRQKGQGSALDLLGPEAPDPRS